MIKKLFIINFIALTTTYSSCYINNCCYYTRNVLERPIHHEVFIGTGNSHESARQDAYRSVYSQGRSVHSVDGIETKSIGNGQYMTVFKIKTQ